MKCAKCGTEYKGNFCPKCGSMQVIEEQSKSLQKTKKPVYTRRWAWSIVFIVVIVVIAGGYYIQTNNIFASQIGQTYTSVADKKVDLSNVEKEFTLTAGIYTAGIDIPSGKFNVTAVSGDGKLISSNSNSGGISEMFGIDDGQGLYTSSFNGLKLSKDENLYLSGDLKIKLVYTSIDSDFSGRTYDESKAVTLSDGNYEAGVDFTAGVYKIVAVYGKGCLLSPNMFNGGLNEVFGVDDGSGFYNGQFVNANLGNGVTLNISGGLEIKMIPAK